MENDNKIAEPNKNHAYLLVGDSKKSFDYFIQIMNKYKISDSEQLLFAEDFNIAKARELIKWLSSKPVNSDWKASYIDLTGAQIPALNAILKVLEEPPKYGLLFVRVKNQSLTLPTIKSRCQTIWIGEIEEKAEIEINYNDLIALINSIPKMLEKNSAKEIIGKIIYDLNSSGIDIDKKTRINEIMFEVLTSAHTNVNQRLVVEYAILRRAKELGDI